MYAIALGKYSNLPGAEQALRRTLELKPGHLRAQANLGRVLIDLGKFEAAVGPLQRVLENTPENRAVRIGLVKALIRLRRYTEAESYCNATEQNKADDDSITMQLGIIRLQQGRPFEAVVLFDQVLSRHPASVTALMNKGLAYKSAAMFDEAINQFRQAVSLAPGLDVAWDTQGLIWMMKGNMEQAATCYERAFQLNPGNINAGHQLAHIYRHMLRANDAKDIYRRILEVCPDDVRARFFMKACRIQADGGQLERIPADYVQEIYSGSNVGRALDTSLTEKLEYRAPAVLDAAVRELIVVPESGLDILEVGCGTGLCGSRLADIANILVGTDLSADLLAVAGEMGAYDRIYVADLIDALSDSSSAYDLVIAMDVLCFFGDLTEIFRKCHRTLRDAGVFALSVMKPETNVSWEFHPSGHFVHSISYLQNVAQETGFAEIFVKEMALRRETGEDRIGHVCLFRRD